MNQYTESCFTDGTKLYQDPPPSYEEVVEGRKPPFQSQLTFCTSETSNETLVRPSFQSHSFGRSFSSTIANERNFRKVIFSITVFVIMVSLGVFYKKRVGYSSDTLGSNDYMYDYDGFNKGYTDYKNKQRCTLPCVFGECRFVNDDQIDIGGNTSQETPVYSARGPTGLKLKQVCDCKSAAGTVFEYDKHCALVLPPDKCPCQNGICKPIPRKPITTTNYLDVQYAKSENLIKFKYFDMTIRFKCYCSHGQRYNLLFSDIS